ncbi:MAG: CvpA family protein [Candidatus Omnitrophota bacterium]
MEIFARASLIDLIFIIFCVRILYISVVRGPVCEFFKLLGLLAGSFFAFQYYIIAADNIKTQVSFLTGSYLYAAVFFLIFTAVVLIFSALRAIVCFLFKKEEIPRSHKWLSFALGAARALLFSSILIFILSLLPFCSQRTSFFMTNNLFRKAAPQVYLFLSKIYKDIYPQAQLNKEVETHYEAKESLSGNNKERH